MVVVAALGAALSVAARPGRHIDREHQRFGGRQRSGQEVAEPFGVDVAADQRGVGAAPAAPMSRLQAQVRQRRERLGAQQRITKVHQRIGAAGAAGVQLGAEGAELLKRGR